MDREVEKIFVDILKSEMSLPNDNIWIQSQNTLIPADDDLYTIVGFTDSTTICNNNSFETTETTQIEVQEVLQQENIQIDFLSRSNDARLRRWEYLAALKSIYSQQQQELYRFRIFRIPNSFVNTTVAEGGTQLNRFTITIPCHVWYRKEKVVADNNYFSDFPARVDDQKTIQTAQPLIEFRITEDELSGNGSTVAVSSASGNGVLLIQASGSTVSVSSGNVDGVILGEDVLGRGSTVAISSGSAAGEIVSVTSVDRLVVAAGQSTGLDMANLNSIVIRF